MEPVAHYGIRENEKDIKIDITWTNGIKNTYKIININETIEIKQKN